MNNGQEKERDMDWLKKILNNFPLLKWIRKFSADGLEDKSKANGLDVETCEDSICIADSNSIKMFFSSARFSGETYASFDLKQIKEVLALSQDEGRLIVGKSDNSNQLCYIQQGGNVVVIAPTTGSDVGGKDKKKKEFK